VNLTDLDKDDLQNVCDGLALLPIHKGYNTFNKVMQQVRELNAPPSPAASSDTLPPVSLVQPASSSS